MKKLNLSLFTVIVVIGIVLVACSRDNSSGSTTLRVRMTDAPVAADAVNVDIEEVRVKFRDGADSTDGWMNLNTNAGIYDLLGLTNGVDTLLAVGVVPTSMVKEIRFILGSDNTIEVGGVVYPLTIPSGSESGLKIKVNKKLNGSLDSLLIDFDAALSIHQTGTGAYQLKPVLKIK
jgi:hypothetical protein